MKNGFEREGPGVADSAPGGAGAAGSNPGRADRPDDSDGECKYPFSPPYPNLRRPLPSPSLQVGEGGLNADGSSDTGGSGSERLDVAVSASGSLDVGRSGHEDVPRNNPDHDAYRLDKRQVRSAFDRAAPVYDQHAVLQREVRERLLDRLQWIRLAPERIVDLGSGPGLSFRALAKRYSKAQVINLDLSWAMARRAAQQRRWLRRPWSLCADIEALPLADATIDLALSAAALQWVNDLDRTFAEVRRVLAGGGLWLFATFGPDTLHELRAAFASVSGEKAAPRINRFFDLHDIGDALLRAGFADPVMDQEHLTLTYADFPSLLRDLRGVGVRNALAGRERGLFGPRRLQAVADAYRAEFVEAGRLPATWEIVYGHAWAPDAPAPSALAGRVIPIRPIDAGR